jgi:hypothetical protein
LNSRSWSHNPTPQPLGHGHIWCLRERSNLRVRLFRPGLVHLSYAGESGGDGENRTLIGWVQTSSPSVERRPHGCGGGNRTHLMAAYETAVCASSSPPHQVWSTEQDSNLRPSAYQAEAQPTRALGRWSPAQESNSLLRFTGAAHRRQCLRGSNLEPAERIERSSVAYHAPALPLSYTGWSRRADSNRHLSFTRAPFFPLNYFDLPHQPFGASNRIRTGVRTMARSNPSVVNDKFIA